MFADRIRASALRRCRRRRSRTCRLWTGRQIDQVSENVQRLVAHWINGWFLRAVARSEDVRYRQSDAASGATLLLLAAVNFPGNMMSWRFGLSTVSSVSR